MSQDLAFPRGSFLRRRGFMAAGAGLLAASPALAQPLAPPPGQPAPGGASPNGQPIIDVPGAQRNPIPIAVTGLGGPAGGIDIGSVISADLARCGLFRPLDAVAPDQPGTPNFDSWKAAGAHALITGNVSGTDPLRVEFRLWDVLQGQQIQGTAYSTTASNWRRIAHIIADVVYERLVGEKGYFDTQIVYVAASGPRGAQVKRLAIMDQDSFNNRDLTDGSWLVLTPRFNPVRNQIAFMSYFNNRPRVYLYDLTSNRQTSFGEFQGMSFAPRFSPDGSACIMSVTRGGGSDIFVVDVATHASRQITSSGAIDTSPCYSPDGSKIVFTSDRSGDPQLYVMGASGGGASRISYGHGEYSTPVWSPRGDLIAFTRHTGGTFAIGVMAPDGTGERILSESFAVEGPTFAPNGRVLMFFRQTRARDSRGDGFSSRLVSIDITGFNEREVPTHGNASDPAWSPLLS
jgi:TolB protein